MPGRATGATQEARPAPDWKWGSKPVEGPGRKSPRDNNLKGRWDVEPTGEADWSMPRCQERASQNVIGVIVPQTDTGRWGEYPKALERTLVKELGNLAP